MAAKKTKPDYLSGIFILIVFAGFSFFNWSLPDKIDDFIYRSGSGFGSSASSEVNEVVIVSVSPEDLNKSSVENRPGSAGLVELADRLNSLGVKLIGFSMPFRVEQSASALNEFRALYEEVNAYPPGDKAERFKEWVLENIDKFENRIASKDIFPDAFTSAENIIVPVTDTGSGSVTPLSVEYLNSSGADASFIKEISVEKLAFSYPELLNSAGGIGFIPDNKSDYGDDLSWPVYWGYNGVLVPSLPLRMAIFYNGLKPVEVEADKIKIVIKDKVLPLINGRMYFPLVKDKYAAESLTYDQVMGDFKKLPDLKNKVVIIGFNDSDSKKMENVIPDRRSSLAARQFASIINCDAVSRPSFIIFIESLFFIIAVFFMVSRAPQKSYLFSFTGFLFVIAAAAGISLFSLSFLGVWFKAGNIITGTVILYVLFLLKGNKSASGKKESNETRRILGLNYQSQGELDLAFKEFKNLPLDKETKDLIYNLGLEYEKRKLNEKALEVYNYINKSGSYRDLNDRIPMLRESDRSSTMGSYRDMNDSNVLVDSSDGPARTMVGRYKILGELGKGSMGLVYKAQDPKINRIVAIKTIRFSDEFEEDVIAEIKERFFTEAEIAGKLSHPAIVTIHDVGEDRDLTYMAMECLEGEDLEKYIVKDSLLPVRSVIDVIAQIAEALEFAHKEGVVHRDIKPANVMLLTNGKVKVTDFGIAKAISSSKTKTGVILGTPNYMSPEQIMGQKIDFKSDIFSLGVLFYQLLTGELPFHGDNLSGLLYQITQVRHSSPRVYNQKIPKVCEQILDKALSKDPAKRFKSAGDMAHIIRALGEKIDELKKKKISAEQAEKDA